MLHRPRPNHALHILLVHAGPPGHPRKAACVEGVERDEQETVKKKRKPRSAGKSCRRTTTPVPAIPCEASQACGLCSKVRLAG
jgi:hypothetical protein